MRLDPKDGRAGTHLRVIVGYREKENKIESLLYSDSWGKRSVEQEVSFDTALAMTTGLYLACPRNESAPPAHYAQLPKNITLELIPIPEASGIDAFSIGKYEVTQQQYRAIMGKNLSYNKGENFPVERVSWEEAIEFCKKLTESERKSGRITKTQFYTLPTPQQWFYACGGSAFFQLKKEDIGRCLLYSGISSRDYINSASKLRPALIEDYAWEYERGERKTHPVGKKKPNDFGIHDMHGNVHEWCRNKKFYGTAAAYNHLNSAGRSPAIGFRIVLIEFEEK